MVPRLRPVLAGLPGYVPGRRPSAGQDYARLASNETPFAPLPSVAAAAAAAVGEGHRYPDPQAVLLVEAIAAFHGVEPEQVAVGCGSVALVQQLLAATADQGDEVVYAWRSFEAYPVLTRLAGAAPVEVPLQDEALDLDALAEAVTDRTRLVLLCSPNNPTGPALAADRVRGFLDEVRPDVLVVLDEAYAEFVTDPAAVDGRAFLDRPNVAVLRTFSKAYGLAGLRVGYSLSSPAVTAALRQVQLPFSVSVVAQATAVASLAAQSELATRVLAVTEERARVRAELLSLGFDVPDAQGNFVWLPLRAAALEAAAVFEEHGVLVRPFAGDGVRATIGTPAENDRLLDGARALSLSSAGAGR
ncbi:MAG: histidinol-phosphate transaminase [Actinomycetota bacterium]|nr:histidinol-phosphate transaminase [Actinomycetota bacterium]